jgi:hypothetical protein
MVTTGTKYVIVENAGYEGGQDVKSFLNYWQAVRWTAKHQSEYETLHVGIRRDSPDGTSEYV